MKTIGMYAEGDLEVGIQTGELLCITCSFGEHSCITSEHGTYLTPELMDEMIKRDAILIPTMLISNRLIEGGLIHIHFLMLLCPLVPEMTRHSIVGTALWLYSCKLKL